MSVGLFLLIVIFSVWLSALGALEGGRRRGLSMKRRTDIGFIITKIVAYAFSILLTLVCFFPVVTLLVSSTHTTNEILRGMSIIPGTSFFENLSRISFTDLGINIWGAMGNSLIIAVSSSILSVYISAMTAYAIKAYRARGSRLFYGMILMVIMIPAQVSIIGFYKYVSMLGLFEQLSPSDPSGCSRADDSLLYQAVSGLRNADFAYRGGADRRRWGVYDFQSDHPPDYGAGNRYNGADGVHHELE